MLFKDSVGIRIIHTGFCLLHLPPALHPFILGDIFCKHLPPPFLQHVGERKCGHDGECLFQQEVDFCFCKVESTQNSSWVVHCQKDIFEKLSSEGFWGKDEFQFILLWMCQMCLALYQI